MQNSPRPGQLFLIFIVALLDTGSDICLKLGALQSDKLSNWVPWLGTSALASPWTWASIAQLVAGFLMWMKILKDVPLGVAYTLSNVVHVTVPISAWLLLNEQISPARWAGIALVVVGLYVVAQPFVKIEEKL